MTAVDKRADAQLSRNRDATERMTADLDAR